MINFFASRSLPDNKYSAESSFWKEEINNYIKWYNHLIPELWGTKAPQENEKVVAQSLKDSAILTWWELHQKVKYVHDLGIDKDEFSGLKVLDIGSGPMPSALGFNDIELYCLDPLLSNYLDIGFPIHYYDKTKFIHANSESIPVRDNFFDVVISVNALDHVDDFEQTAKEIRRVLKPNGKVAFHLHYHKPTITEPIVLNDVIVASAFSGINNLQVKSRSVHKMGYQCANDEEYVVWTNF